MLKPNEGSMDRVVRAFVGILFIAIALSLTGWIKVVLIILGLIVLATAVLGYCGLYTLLHINTLDTKHHDANKATDHNSSSNNEVELEKEIDKIKPATETTQPENPEASSADPISNNDKVAEMESDTIEETDKEDDKI